MSVQQSSDTPIKSVHCIIVFDESGSMSELADEAQKSMTKFVQNQQKDAVEGKYELFFTLVKFNSNITTVFDRKKISDLSSFSGYNPCGFTALYQAVGETIEKYKDEKSNTILIVLTDGQENYSKREYTREYMNTLIEERKKAGWEIAFLGANQSQCTDAERMGITNSAPFDCTPQGLAYAMNGISRSVSGYARAGCMPKLDRVVSTPLHTSDTTHLREQPIKSAALEVLPMQPKLDRVVSTPLHTSDTTQLLALPIKSAALEVLLMRGSPPL